jgi:diaminopimelate decarboxylase
VTGTIAKTSTFGVPLMDSKDELLGCFDRFAWLTCIHCHVGSQGCEMALLIRGACSVLALAEEINARFGGASPQIRTLDIGGGMPVDYGSDVSFGEQPINPIEYTRLLRAAAPALFDEARYTLVTEYGRWISAKCGLMISRVEYTKFAGGRRIATVHCGADLYVRTAYQPQNWPHRVSAWSATGEFLDPATGPCNVWDVVGPLCFRGDIVAAGVHLPSSLKSGCGVVIHDSGAYTISMFSKYNSRQAPPVYGFSDGGTKVFKLSDAETLDECLRTWQVPRGS